MSGFVQSCSSYYRFVRCMIHCSAPCNGLEMLNNSKLKFEKKNVCQKSALEQMIRIEQCMKTSQEIQI